VFTFERRKEIMTNQMAACIAAYNRVSAARAAYRALWVSACEYDKIEPDSKFVIFSEGNPHFAALNKAGGELLDAMSAREVKGAANV
jgi:hypothetical protein